MKPPRVSLPDTSARTRGQRTMSKQQQDDWIAEPTGPRTICAEDARRLRAFPSLLAALKRTAHLLEMIGRGNPMALACAAENMAPRKIATVSFIEVANSWS